ncbi:MAG: hypothetical protein PUA94_02405 [Bacteroidales bacterium]|nr:hypothetical protein [Bacteroidales bacterium]
MDSIRLRHILTLLICLFLTAGASAATVVKARLDSTTLLMGKMTTLQISVQEPTNVSGHFELFKNIHERGYASVCGDSVELRAPVSIDTVVTGKERKLLFKVPVQSFDSGAYMLPELAYVVGMDTFRTNPVALKVVPVNANADDPIADYAGVSDPEDPSFFDWVPDWMLDFWWIILLVLLAIGIFVYMLRRYKKVGHILPQKPVPTPYEEAMSALRQLKAKGLWEQGLEKEYYTELTEILRHYLYRRFGINALEMTSRQILHCLSGNPETKDKRAYFRKILDMADFVKFAKVRPLPDDNVASYDNAVRFVEETKPVPVTEKEDAGTADTKQTDKRPAAGSGSSRKGGAR